MRDCIIDDSRGRVMRLPLRQASGLIDYRVTNDLVSEESSHRINELATKTYHVEIGWLVSSPHLTPCDRP